MQSEMRQDSVRYSVPEHEGRESDSNKRGVFNEQWQT